MFKFGKQKVKLKKTLDNKEEKSDLDELIHVMPARFYIQPKKSRLGLIVIVIISFLIIAGLAIAGYFLNENLKKKRLMVNQNINQLSDGLSDVQDVVQPQDNNNLNVNQNDNSNVNVNIDISPTSTNDVVPSPVSPDDPVVEPAQPIGPIDSDQDGLTNLEEALFDTNPNSNDSDGDGYYDGEEILNGYDPTSPSLTLGASGLFSSYNHQNYSINYPRKWTLREQDKNNNEVLFISDVGEFVEVLVIPNIKNLTIEDWFAELLPDVTILPSNYVNINNAVGVRVNDDKTYYLFDSSDTSRVFVLTYNNGSSNIYNFKITFGVMANSFKIIK